MLIQKRYDGLLVDADSRRKLAASLMRNGYTMREIREAMTLVSRASSDEGV
jgi:SOS response regulatory protein OraA/RecX